MLNNVNIEDGLIKHETVHTSKKYNASTRAATWTQHKVQPISHSTTHSSQKLSARPRKRANYLFPRSSVSSETKAMRTYPYMWIYVLQE